MNEFLDSTIKIIHEDILRHKEYNSPSTSIFSFIFNYIRSRELEVNDVVYDFALNKVIGRLNYGDYTFIESSEKGFSDQNYPILRALLDFSDVKIKNELPPVMTLHSTINNGMVHNRFAFYHFTAEDIANKLDMERQSPTAFYVLNRIAPYFDFSIWWSRHTKPRPLVSFIHNNSCVATEDLNHTDEIKPETFINKINPFLNYNLQKKK